MKNNMEILSNKSVATMTGHELLELFQLLQDRQKESRVEKQSMNDYLGFPRFVTGIKELASNTYDTCNNMSGYNYGEVFYIRA